MNRFFAIVFLFAVGFSAQAQEYRPSEANLTKRALFQDMKFGMFIHWGPSSILGAGEWVMNNRGIHKDEYKKLQDAFFPQHFDAKTWVSTAKQAGMKYIVFVTRHHDSFSNWDTQYSDWKITNTPYGQDVLKALADECRQQGIHLGLYYSLTDWYRNDYPHQTGRTGKKTGRLGEGNYQAYLQFMKNQLTELLTQYGDVLSVWFDGHWDQTNVEGSDDLRSRLDWRYDEIYGLIHKLQPACLIGNNHHLDPFPGEDFQMFERDLPGQNKSGFSFQAPSDELPVETCETMNNSWGYNITDENYKSSTTLIHFLVNAAGRNANLLLNIGPRPDGSIPDVFADTLSKIGEWLNRYGATIYGTRGKMIEPQEWGVVTATKNKAYVHLLRPVNQNFVFLPGFVPRVIQARLFPDGRNLRFKQQPEGLFISIDNIVWEKPDTVIELLLK